MRQIWGARIDCCSRSYRRPGAPKIRPSGYSPQTARQTKACSMRFLFNERCKSSRYITYRSKFYVLVKILIVVRLICLQLILLIGRLNLEIAKAPKDFKTDDAIIIHKISTHRYNLRIKKYLEYRLAENILHNKTSTVFICLLYTSPSPRDLSTSRMPSSA